MFPCVKCIIPHFVVVAVSDEHLVARPEGGGRNLSEFLWPSGGVSAVAFDGAGNLYILDDQAAQITVVDLRGNLVRQFGRVGEGPGEFSGDGTWALTVCSDERIAVYDAGRRAFVLFGADGEFERGIPLDGPTTIISVRHALHSER